MLTYLDTYDISNFRSPTPPPGLPPTPVKRKKPLVSCIVLEVDQPL